MAPITIKKHWFGLVEILTVGLGFFVFIVFVIGYLLVQRQITETYYLILAAFDVLVLLATVIQAYVYTLSSITLDDQGITVTNWFTLLSSQDGQADWTKVQDVSVKKDGVLPQILDYGILLIQTAGTEEPLQITYIPRPDYWQDFIANKAESTPVLTHSV